jgi:hypothetical protein
VAPGVVEVLEVVRVDNQNAEARTVVVDLLYGLIEALLPKPTVWKIRQFIRGRRLCCACHPFFGRRKDYGWRGGNIRQFHTFVSICLRIAGVQIIEERVNLETMRHYPEGQHCNRYPLPIRNHCTRDMSKNCQRPHFELTRINADCRVFVAKPSCLDWLFRSTSARPADCTHGSGCRNCRGIGITPVPPAA